MNDEINTPAAMYLARKCSMDDMCACIAELADEACCYYVNSW